MDFIYILLGINTIVVFIYKRDWLLSKKSFIKLLIINLFLMLLGYLLQYYSVGNQKLVVALKMPVLSQCIFMGLVVIFRKIYHRDPVDTFWSMDLNQMKDGIFNSIFFILGIMLPAILVFGK